MLGLYCYTWAFSVMSGGYFFAGRKLLFVVRGLLITVASPVTEHGI